MADVGENQRVTLDKPKTKHLSKEDINRIYISGIKDIDATIDNYKEALISRGIEDREWLTAFLRRQKASMQQQLTNNIEVGTGNADPQKIYNEPKDFSAFYDLVYQEYLRSNGK